MDEKIEIARAIKAENVLESNRAFQIEPEFVVEILEKAETGNKEMLGFFHSHPNLSAFVSPRDEKYMRLWLEKIWVIAGTDERGKVTEVKAFTWIDEGWGEIEIKP